MELGLIAVVIFSDFVRQDQLIPLVCGGMGCGPMKVYRMPGMIFFFMQFAFKHVGFTERSMTCVDEIRV